MNRLNTARLPLSCILVWSVSGGPAAAQTYSFGVLSQLSAVLTAQYWNPILAYVKDKTGVDLLLKIARTAPESNDATERGEYDFVYWRSWWTSSVSGWCCAPVCHR